MRGFLLTDSHWSSIPSLDMGIRPTPDALDLLPGTLYLLILRTLATGPLHGYGIARRIKDASAEALAVEEGSLYPALNRMLVKRWVTAEWGVSENNRKARFYRLTVEGRRQLEQESRQFDAIVRAIRLVMEST